jgi:hypothetical protein
MAEHKIAGSTFELVSKRTLRRLIMSARAVEKSGKTHFALTAPDPIAVLNTDIGLEGVVEKFIDSGKTIYATEVRMPLLGKKVDQQLVAKEAEERFNILMADFKAALADKTIRTVVFDSATQVWELLRLARFGKLTQVMPQHYTAVNTEYEQLMREAYASDKNLILLHKMKDEWLDNNRTGKKELAGYKDTPFLTQLNVLLTRHDREDGVEGSDFRLKVLDCRQNPEINNLVLENENATFPMLGQLIYPDTSAEDWQ